MSNDNIFDEMIKVVNDLEEGILIPKENIANFLRTYKNYANETISEDDRIEFLRYEFSKVTLHQQLDHDQSMAEYRIVNESGQSALKTLFILNGSAAVALAAFISKLDTLSDASKISALAYPISNFTLAAFLAACSFATVYLSHMAPSLFERGSKKALVAWSVLNTITIIIAFAGYVLFALGLWQAHDIFTK